MSCTIRRYRADDLDAVIALFKDSVHTICLSDYSLAQLAVWAPDTIDSQKWAQSLASNICYVADDNGQLRGFADMTADGYLDRLYVASNYQGRMLSIRLGKALLTEAKQLGLSTITADVSITAKPLAEKMGFKHIKQQTIVRGDVELTNYKMQLSI